MFTRLATTLAVFALLAPPAGSAWTWPATGEVIRGFDYGGGAYTASGHRGIDIAGAAGAEVLAPAAGHVSFAGSLPSNGRAVSIRTADGWAVTLTQLGSVIVSVGDGVAEGETVGTIAAASEPAAVPHVQLGTRRADDPRGYVDPLTLLPPRLPAPPPAAAPTPVMSAPQAAPGAVEPAPTESVPSTEAARRTAPAGAGPAVMARPPQTRRLSTRHAWSGDAPDRDARSAEAASAAAERSPPREAGRRAGNAASAGDRAARDRHGASVNHPGRRARTHCRGHAGRAETRAEPCSGFAAAVDATPRGNTRPGRRPPAPPTGREAVRGRSGGAKPRAYHGRP